MSRARYIAGIDFGTTHSVVAYSPADKPDVKIFNIPQLTGPGEVSEKALLPSAVYLNSEDEFQPASLYLPWGMSNTGITGEMAVRRGAEVPGRLVSSAKSWLCHEGVDRTAPILPWSTERDIRKISPLEASSNVLEHIRSAWDYAHPDAPLAKQEVVLTVPASFDEVARELTVEAAKRAGLDRNRLRLLEEPQAAFYDWLLHNPDFSDTLSDIRLALVIDVGGGTTDLTLVQVEPQQGGAPKLKRIAVGDHLILGGDNMDAALSGYAEQILNEKGDKRLDTTELQSLMLSARRAKESLLGESPPENVKMVISRRGKKLIGGTRTISLDRKTATKLLLDGFLPVTSRDEVPDRKKRLALCEIGLTYATDPGITRHINDFLRRHAQAAMDTGVKLYDGLPRPDAILLNGGFFNAKAVVNRISDVLSGWFDSPVPMLLHESLDLAVARGAAWYGMARRGFGVKIGGGAARGYYIGIDTGKEKKAICVVPRGMEEGSEADIQNHTFSLRTGEPVTFPIYTSTSGHPDNLGDLVSINKNISPLPPLHTVIRSSGIKDRGSGKSKKDNNLSETCEEGKSKPAKTPAVHGAGRLKDQSAEVPVKLSVFLTEIGTLELSLVTPDESRRRWRLEFSVRGDNAAGGGSATAPIDELPRRFDDAKALMELCYGRTAKQVEPREIKNLWRNLEKILGRRELWSSAANRELWGIVWSGAKKRRRTADHERVWYQLSGFCLRPGFGAPLDEWRISEIGALLEKGVQYTTEAAVWSEWWIMWRRIAGGLTKDRQNLLFEFARPWLEPPRGRVPRKPRGPKASGHDEMMRMAASLERIAPDLKIEAAEWFLHRMETGKGGRSWWPLGRIGARQPFYGSAHDVVDRSIAESWLERLLSKNTVMEDGASFAISQIARYTGDRARDIDLELRMKAARTLKNIRAPETWIRMLTERVSLSEQDEKRVFGDTLPSGLRLGA